MEILATIPVYTYPWFYDFLLCISIVVVMSGVMLFISPNQFFSYNPTLVGLSLIIIGIFGIIFTNNTIEKTKTLNYNEYKVIIDETISAKDFLDKYEVISKEGEIFTVREIESD